MDWICQSFRRRQPNPKEVARPGGESKVPEPQSRERVPKVSKHGGGLAGDISTGESAQQTGVGSVWPCKRMSQGGTGADRIAAKRHRMWGDESHQMPDARLGHVAAR